MKKFTTYSLRVVLAIFVGALVLSPIFADVAELNGLGLTPMGYLPVVVDSGVMPTPSPTTGPTPTSTSSSPADVQITFIMYNPPGDDVAGEYIEITNLGGTPQNIENWRIKPTTFAKDGDRQVLHDPFYFPSYVIEPGQLARVWTKEGIDIPPNFYWNTTTEVWLNDGDFAQLYDDNGILIDECTYLGGGQDTHC